MTTLLLFLLGSILFTLGFDGIMTEVQTNRHARFAIYVIVCLSGGAILAAALIRLVRYLIPL